MGHRARGAPPRDEADRQYERLQLVGKGSFGQVYLVRHRRTSQTYVMKVISLVGMGRPERDEACREASLLQRLDHPNIIRYHASFEAASVLRIVTEYASRGDLHNFVQARRGKRLREPLVLDWFLQTCLGVKHLHERHILHRDIKTSNIFLNDKGVIKIGDFGISKVLAHTMQCAKTAVGTPYYMSPEICQNKPYNNRSDVWALGCVLYELCTLRHAFEAMSLKSLVAEILRGRYKPIPAEYSPALRGLVSATLQRCPDKRPSVHALVQTDVLKARIQAFLAGQSENVFAAPQQRPLPRKKKPAAAAPAPAAMAARPLRAMTPPHASPAVEPPSPPASPPPQHQRLRRRASSPKQQQQQHRHHPGGNDGRVAVCNDVADPVALARKRVGRVRREQNRGVHHFGVGGIQMNRPKAGPAPAAAAAAAAAVPAAKDGGAVWGKVRENHSPVADHQLRPSPKKPPALLPPIGRLDVVAQREETRQRGQANVYVHDQGYARPLKDLMPLAARKVEVSVHVGTDYHRALNESPKSRSGSQREGESGAAPVPLFAGAGQQQQQQQRSLLAACGVDMTQVSSKECTASQRASKGRNVFDAFEEEEALRAEAEEEEVEDDGAAGCGVVDEGDEDEELNSGWEDDNEPQARRKRKRKRGGGGRGAVEGEAAAAAKAGGGRGGGDVFTPRDEEDVQLATTMREALALRATGGDGGGGDSDGGEDGGLFFEEAGGSLSMAAAGDVAAAHRGGGWREGVGGPEKFRLDGQTFKLPHVRGSEPLSYRVEVLRQNLEGLLGSSHLLAVHKMLRDADECEEEGDDLIQRAKDRVGNLRAPYIPLVMQLVVCEDILDGEQG